MNSSKDDDENGSSGSGDGGGDSGGIGFIEGVGVDHISNEFLRYLSDADATPPRDLELGAFPDGPPRGPPLMTQPPSPSNNSHYARGETSSPTFVPLVIEDDEAPPRPPEMIVASFEGEKAGIIEDGDIAFIPEQHVAASVEGHGDEEEKREEVEDAEAPRPPEMIAASLAESFEGKKAYAIEDGDTDLVPEQRIAASVEWHSDEEEKREEVGETPVTVEYGDSLMDPSSISRRQISTTANMRVGMFPITPPLQRGDEPSLPSGAGQGHVEMSIPPAQESMPPPRPNLGRSNHSLPLLEATLVDEEVYEAFPMSDTRDNDARGWSRIPHKYRVIILGLVLVAMAAIIAVVVLVVGSQKDSTASNVATDPSMTSTTSTTIMIGPTNMTSANSTTALPIMIGPTNMTVATDPSVTSTTSPTNMTSANSTTALPSSITVSPTAPLVIPSPSESATVNPTTPLITDSPSEFPTTLLQSQFTTLLSPTTISPTMNPPTAPLITTNPSTSPIAASPTSEPTSSLWWTTLIVTSPSVSPTTDNPTSAPTVPPIISTPVIPTSAPVAFLASAWRQQGPAIVGDAADDELGYSVALSADAKTLVVGAPGYFENTDIMGYVKVYRADEDGGDRVQLGETIYGDAVGDQFGYSVDVSPDGNTLVIGSPGLWMVSDQPGYVRIFSLESSDDLGTGNWKQIGQDIIGEAISDGFGSDVSLSEDGKTIAVGAPNYDGNGDSSGHVRVYRLDDSGLSWMQLGEDIDGEAAGDYSGVSVSLSADGNTVAIGAPYAGIDDVWTGQVKVYRIDSEGSIWEPLGQSIYGDNANDYFGESVNISPDGNTLAIGSPGLYDDSDRPGYVRVFSWENVDDLGTGSWEQIGDDIIGEGIGDLFGYSVSLSEDGKTIAVGAMCNNGNGDDSGHVRVYQVDDSGSSWMQLGEDIDGDAADDISGFSLSLSPDGKTVAIGSIWNDDNGLDSGHVRIFVVE